jgi:hypothetical protein
MVWALGQGLYLYEAKIRTWEVEVCRYKTNATLFSLDLFLVG